MGQVRDGGIRGHRDEQSERMNVPVRRASRGEIWFVQLPTDPPEKGRRPAIVVSSEARNRRDAASTVLVIPLSTSVHKADSPTHLLLFAGETGLDADSIARAEDITVVPKTSLVEPRSRLRTVSDRRICELAAMVKIAMACI
jgi:mRNA-degrading endonuclease toxin of MazEF toxin-antitoxin module